PTRRFRPHQIEPTHLTVQIRSLDAEDPRRFRNAPVLMLQDRGDVVALELRPRLAQGRIESRRADAAFELGVGQYILQPDKPLWNQQDQSFQQSPEFWSVAPPGEG